SGQPTPGEVTRFSVTGAVETGGSATTDAAGRATFCYDGPDLPGSDQISALADTNVARDQAAGEPGDPATNEWLAPESTPRCHVTDNGRITAANGDSSTFHGTVRSR